MISLVDALKDQVVRMRGRLSPRLSPYAWGHSESVFYHTCRVLAGRGDQADKFRVTMLVRANSCVEAEEIAAEELRLILASDLKSLGNDVTVRWLKGRLLSSRPWDEETATTLDLLARLRRGDSVVESAVEPIVRPETT